MRGPLKRTTGEENLLAFDGLTRDMIFYIFGLYLSEQIFAVILIVCDRLIIDIRDLLNCRLVCSIWSKVLLRNEIWIKHVDRIALVFPDIRRLYTDKYHKQQITEGGGLEVERAPKRRKKGGKRYLN